MSESPRHASSRSNDTTDDADTVRLPTWADQRPVRAPGGVEAVLAGFIVWLAGQRLPPGRRRMYHRVVEEFLRWRDRHPNFVQDPAWGYYAELRDSGAGEARLQVTREALAWLARYLGSERHDRDETAPGSLGQTIAFPSPRPPGSRQPSRPRG